MVVDEGVGRVPVLNGGFPADRDVVDFEGVVNDRARMQLDGLGGQDFEPEEAWGQTLEVECIGEEREDFFDGSGEGLGRGDAPDPPVLGVLGG